MRIPSKAFISLLCASRLILGHRLPHPLFLELPVLVLLRGAARVFLLAAVVVAAAIALSACSPTFNWREIRLEAAPLQALMPCKPEAAQRNVPLAGSPTDLHLLACETGGLRFAIAWAGLDATAQVPHALAAWRSASLRAIAVRSEPGDEASTAWVVSVPGATQTLGVQASGQNPAGGSVETRAVYFARGTQVFQAAVYGEQLQAQAMEAFFGALRLPAP
jgi:hypothetical protein